MHRELCGGQCDHPPSVYHESFELVLSARFPGDDNGKIIVQSTMQEHSCSHHGMTLDVPSFTRKCSG